MIYFFWSFLYKTGEKGVEGGRGGGGAGGLLSAKPPDPYKRGGGVNHHFLMEKQPSYGVTLITPFHEAILKEDHA